MLNVAAENADPLADVGDFGVAGHSGAATAGNIRINSTIEKFFKVFQDCAGGAADGCIFVFGVSGEYLGRLYMEVKGRPLFVIDSVEGGPAAAAAAKPVPKLVTSAPGA